MEDEGMAAGIRRWWIRHSETIEWCLLPVVLFGGAALIIALYRFLESTY